MADAVHGVKVCEVCNGLLGPRRRRFCSEPCSRLAARARWLEATYNLSLAEYERILAYQNFGCGICGRPPAKGKSLAVDHAHENGQQGPVRGLLCFFCNKRVLGARSADILVKTAAYVTEPPAVHALGRVVIAPGRPKKPRTRKRRRAR